MTLPAVIRPEDLRMQMSHLASTFAVPLSQANLNAGKSYRPTGGILPEVQQRFARQTAAEPFTGHEWGVAASEREIERDIAFSLTFHLNSYLAAWGPAFLLQDVTSVREAATDRYTHTIRPVNLLASANGMLAKLTDMYFDAGSADASRRKSILLALAVPRVVMSARQGENMQISIDFMGSGKEDTTTAITLAALSSEVLFGGEHWKFERGDQGGGLTDITDKVREWSLEITQALGRRYTPDATTPANAKFARAARVLRRRYQLSWVEEVDRANQEAAAGPKQRALLRTRTETKITVDSGVAFATGTGNHRASIRIPDHRIPIADPNPAEDGATLALTVPHEQMYPSSAIGSVPVDIVVDNDTASYLV